ncbi:MAG TPA: ABC transporter permease [Planctomycetota bacterium]|nr:ABC transporter permease [Planctomycetota bacterium]HRR82603.1 ABC transporter permease [Planctomycetota bacterium]HRT94803.1 ABC transporter permease [Planctomycetota bacterium]
MSTGTPPHDDERSASCEGMSPGRLALRRLLANRLAAASALFLVALGLLALGAPLLAPRPYDAVELPEALKPPSAGHWLGTDALGRDLLSRLLYGARVSLAVGVVATVVSLVIGVSYGAIAGYVGGRTDNLMMRFVDVLYGLPFMFLVILIVMIAGRSLLNLFIALGAVQWLTTARIVRGQVMSLKEREFVEAARALGAGPLRLIFRHIVPNLLGVVIVYATLNVPAVMLQEAFLSFLGLGVEHPMPSWGTLMAEGARSMEVCPWLMVFPGVTFSLTLLALNFLGDGLRDALDPQSR